MLAERPSAPSAGPVELRLTLSLSGGASLGAYQAGACAALLTGIGHLRGEAGLDVRLDAVGGASAGAIVAVMAAHSVLEGLDGASVMRSAWVDRVSIDTLLRRGSRGRLSLEEVRRDLPDLVDEAEPKYEGQPHPVMLHIALTGLRGADVQGRGTASQRAGARGDLRGLDAVSPGARRGYATAARAVRRFSAGGGDGVRVASRRVRTSRGPPWRPGRL